MPRDAADTGNPAASTGCPFVDEVSAPPVITVTLGLNTPPPMSLADTTRVVPLPSLI